jgi:hypothetical protein
METNYEKSKEKDPLDPQTVFTIKHSDIPKGITQCRFEDHKWVKLSDNELKCVKCPTVLIVKDIKQYVC